MFEGAYTAIVTPFLEDGSVDYEAFQSLVEQQVEGGIDGIVPVGTTGESPTLNYEEHRGVIEAAVKAAAGRIKIIAGTGGNSTEEALELTRHAKDAGADGTLQVTPYYNKPSQRGLIQHFTKVADIGLPVVLYNIPGRTAMELSVDTVVELAGHPSVAAIKEASGSVDRVSTYRRRCDIEVLSGDDALTLPKMVVGAVGVISVASNLDPAGITRMVHAALEGNWNEAREMHARYHGLFTDLFIETNPVPVKAALAMMGRIREVYRLPLVGLEDANRQQLKTRLEELGLL